MQLSDDQKLAVQKILKWYFSKNRTQYITLGGYAGTGKTTIISVVKLAIIKLLSQSLQYQKSIEKKSKSENFIQSNKDKNLLISPTSQSTSKKSKTPIKVAFCSYTGKATQNMKNRLEEGNAVSYKDTISTIHGLIYKPIENDKQEIVGWVKNDEIDYDLIIIDEASMVDKQIWYDILSYNIPIIAIGDHGQLPPINGDFNLMQNPHIKLTQIHRQAKQNPIIDVSILARTKGEIPANDFGKNIVKYNSQSFDYSEMSNDLLQNYTEDTLILCGYNHTRNKINQFVRSNLGFETLEPNIGDRVICLRNNHKKNIYNGMIGTITSIYKEDDIWYQAEIQMDDTNTLYKGKIYAPQFGSALPVNFTKDRYKLKDGDIFDYGYALTVHKAQGSQAKRVVLFEERFAKMDEDQWKKWLYTAVTRAQTELFIFGQ